jgi:hypothetical protein
LEGKDVGLFEFPVWGAPRDSEAARRDRKPFNTTADGRLYRPYVWIRVAARGRTRPQEWIEAQLDSGADCCIFAQRVADRLGITRSPGAHEERLRTGAGLVTAWFAQLDLHLGLPADPYEFDWTTPVGFVRDDVLPAAFPSGILGIGGGLERFLSTTLILSPDGPEAPVVRVYTPPA